EEQARRARAVDDAAAGQRLRALAHRVIAEERRQRKEHDEHRAKDQEHHEKEAPHVGEEAPPRRHDADGPGGKLKVRSGHLLSDTERNTRGLPSSRELARRTPLWRPLTANKLASNPLGVARVNEQVAVLPYREAPTSLVHSTKAGPVSG